MAFFSLHLSIHNTPGWRNLRHLGQGTGFFFVFRGKLWSWGRNRKDSPTYCLRRVAREDTGHWLIWISEEQHIAFPKYKYISQISWGTLTQEIHLLLTCCISNLTKSKNLTGRAVYLFAQSGNPILQAFYFALHMSSVYCLFTSLFMPPQPLKGSHCILVTFACPASKQSPAFSRCSAMSLLDRDSRSIFFCSPPLHLRCPPHTVSITFQVQGLRLMSRASFYVFGTHRALLCGERLCPSRPRPHVIPVSLQGLEIVKGQSPPICADLGHHFLETSFASSLIKAVFASPPAFLAITLIKLIFLCSLFAICINGKFIYSVPNSPVTAL